MGVDTRLPDEADAGVTYPRYDERSADWAGKDRVFIQKQIFDEMAKGLLKGITNIITYNVYLELVAALV